MSMKNTHEQLTNYIHLILQEQVFGAQAFVYHGSRAAPKDFLPLLLQDKFRPGVAAGSMYGKGLYTVYDLESGITGKGSYGEYIYKLKVNLYGCISFDSDTTKLIYKKDLTPAQQAEMFGLPDSVVKKLKALKPNEGAPDEISSDLALQASKFLSNEVKGLIYTGRRDGKVALLYDASIAVPIAWKKFKNVRWTKVNKDDIRSAMSKAPAGEWQKEKYEVPVSAQLERQFKKLKELADLPPGQRVIEGDISCYGDIAQEVAEAIPEGLQINGELHLSGIRLKSLPAGIKVEGNVFIGGGSVIESLPPDLQVGSTLSIAGSSIVGIPPGFSTNGSMYIMSDKVTSIPPSLKVGGELIVRNCPVPEIPAGLQVGKSIAIKQSPEFKKLPDNLTVNGNLRLEGTGLRTLPSNLTVKGYLWLSEQGIDSLPSGLKVEGDLYLGDTETYGLKLPEDVDIGGTIRTQKSMSDQARLNNQNWEIRHRRRYPETKKESRNLLRSLVKEVLSQT